MPYRFEEITESHRQAVIDIFNFFVSHSQAAFLDQPVSYAFFDRFKQMFQDYPSWVIKEDPGKVVGFGFLHSYHPARTFQRTAEVTYFILPDHTRKGLGEAILEKLKQAAQKRSIDHILALISSLNQRSLQFHWKNSFYECGRLRKIGKKFGQDFDVIYMQLDL